MSLKQSSFMPRRHLSIERFTAVALVIDAVMVAIGLWFGFWIRFRSGWVPVRETWWTAGGDVGARDVGSYVPLMLFGAGLLMVSFGWVGLYRASNLLRWRRAAMVVAKGTAGWVLLYLAVSLVLKFSPPISRLYVLASAAGVMVTVLTWRYWLVRILRGDSFARKLRQRVAFLGWNASSDGLARAIGRDGAHPYDVVGWISLGQHDSSSDDGEHQRLGRIEEIEAVLLREDVDVLIVADLDRVQGRIIEVANLCERLLVQFKVIPSYFQILVSGLHLESVSSVPILGVSELPLQKIGNRALKRLVDVVGATVGLVLSSPIMLVVGVLIVRESPGPIFFSQERVGRGGRRFRMLKLRSMRLGSDKEDHLNQSTLREDPRLLRIGAFIRKWNLDEVPQFWNVLKGDMSLVGPRPERTYHSEKLSLEIPHYNARLMSKPGITGWAQVNGLRGDTDLAERVRFDLYYLENWNVLLDFQIMFQTFLKRDNAY
jgi:exopolysaccharide biosynthesis polyprenyl glycosylphosphotransferase